MSIEEVNGMTVAIPLDGVKQALWGVATAIVAMGGFIGFLVRWMMGRVEESTKQTADVIATFSETTATFSRVSEEQAKLQEQIEESHEGLIATQREIRDELRKLVEKVR